MTKSLIDLCMFCIANNLENIKRAGSSLCKNDKELLLELLCDHDMFTAKRIPFVTKQLLSPTLTNIAFGYSGQVDDALLQKLALSRCKLRSFVLKNCPQVSGEKTFVEFEGAWKPTAWRVKVFLCFFFFHSRFLTKYVKNFN